MARPIWKGHISFGLVSIPVVLYSGERTNDLSFHLIDKRNRSRVRYCRVNDETGEEVPSDEIVRGYEFEKGRYVLLSDEDFQRADADATKRLDIEDFVDADAIEPGYFEKPYVLEPDKGGNKGYALLRETLRMQNKVGIARMVMRRREYLTAIMPVGDLLEAVVLRFEHELKEQDEFEAPSVEKDIEMSQREIDMAVQLVDAMSAKWEPEKYKDHYRDRLMAYINEKVEAGDFDAETEAPPEAEEEEPSERVVNLTDYLRQSVEAARKKREAGEEPDKQTSKKKSAKKAASKAPSRKKAKKRAATKETTKKRQTA